MNRVLGLVLVFCTIFIPAFAQKRPARSSAAKPAIKSNTPPPTAEKASTKIGLTIEKYTSSYDINADGTAKHVWELQQKCGSPACFDRVRNVKYVFNGDLQNFRLIEAFIIKPNGTKVIVPMNASKIQPTPQAEAAPGFSSLREFEIAFDNLKLGDSAYFKLQIDTKKPIFDKHFSSLELFSSIFEWSSIEINLSAPADYPLFTEAVGLEGGKLANEGGRARWQWKKQGFPAISVESLMMDAYGKSPRFAVTSFSSHDELGRAFWAGIKEKAVITPEIKDLADQITKDISEPDEQISAIYRWVNKNIRYLSVVLDRGGWVPHSSAEIIQNRYGDCKDYTTIIYTLLKAKGFDSVPVLIRSEGGSWFPEVAALGYFNHAILYVPSLKLFADATSPNTRLGIIPQLLVGKKAVLAGEKTGIIEVPKNIPDDNQMLSDVEITIAASGDLKAVSQNTYLGRSEILFRPLFAQADIARNSDLFVKLLLAYSGIQGTGRMIEISDPYKVRDPFTLKMEVELPQYISFGASGKIDLPIGINLINSIELGALALEEKRETDLMIGASRIREKFRIAVPEHVKIGVLPEPRFVENSAGTYKYSFTLEEGKVSVLREIVLTKDVVSPAEYPAFRELVKASQEDLYKAIEYTADPKGLQANKKQTKVGPSKKPQSVEDILFSVVSPGAKLSAAQVRRLEASLIENPNDSETRLSLLEHYDMYAVKQTPAIQKARVEHRLWFIRNKPAIDTLTAYRWSLGIKDKNSVEYRTLRDEWLKQIDAKKTDHDLRLNAAWFIRNKEPEVAKKILLEGISIDPDQFEFPSMLTEIYLDEYKEASGKADPELVKTILDTGAKTLSTLRTERSNQRDLRRTELLVGLCPVAIEAGRMDLAESFGRELILAFGDDTFDPDFQTGTHIGNIALGQVELSRGNFEKASEYLLISIRAPLRRDEGYFNDFDLTLAKELYKKGQRKAVADYLKLCLQLGSFKTDAIVHQKKMRSIRSWITMIEKDIEPSFDLSKP